MMNASADGPELLVVFGTYRGSAFDFELADFGLEPGFVNPDDRVM